MNKADVKLTDLSGSTLTIEVIVTKRLRLRVWLGCKLIVLAAYVMGCDLDVKTSLGRKELTALDNMPAPRTLAEKVYEKDSGSEP